MLVYFIFICIKFLFHYDSYARTNYVILARITVITNYRNKLRLIVSVARTNYVSYVNCKNVFFVDVQYYCCDCQINNSKIIQMFYLTKHPFRMVLIEKFPWLWQLLWKYQNYIPETR